MRTRTQILDYMVWRLSGIGQADGYTAETFLMEMRAMVAEEQGQQQRP